MPPTPITKLKKNLPPFHPKTAKTPSKTPFFTHFNPKKQGQFEALRGQIEALKGT